MKNKIKAYKRRDNIAGYVMLAPWLFGFVLMYFLPMLISIYYSFTDYNLLNDAKVIGFDNYVRIFTNDDTFWQALKVTFIYTIFLVPLRLAFALIVAMLGTVQDDLLHSVHYRWKYRCIDRMAADFR